jgi:hypothetical protein
VRTTRSDPDVAGALGNGGFLGCSHTFSIR